MKVTLKGELDARRRDGQWVIDEEFAAIVEEEDGVLWEIRVPAGFVTDFASVPRVPLAYWLTGDTAHEAAVLHDYCYSTGLHPRAWCDEMFAAAMEATGIPAWRRALMYAGVRAGGWAAWNDYRRKEQI